METTNGGSVSDTLNAHGNRLSTLEDEVRLHRQFMFGSFNEQTGIWEDGVAKKLADAVGSIRAIDQNVSDLIGWIKRSGIAAFGLGVSAIGASGWFFATHFDQLVKALESISR